MMEDVDVEAGYDWQSDGMLLPLSEEEDEEEY